MVTKTLFEPLSVKITCNTLPE